MIMCSVCVRGVCVGEWCDAWADCSVCWCVGGVCVVTALMLCVCKRLRYT
jgi:hypothetical protein